MVENDPFDLEGQERTKAEQAKRAKQLSEQRIRDFSWVISDKRGRRFVWWLLEIAGVFRSSFTGNSETFFREGQRNAGLQVLGMIHEHAPDTYSLMLKEHLEQKAKTDK